MVAGPGHGTDGFPMADEATGSKENVTLDRTEGKASPLRLASGRTYRIKVKVFTVKIEMHCDPDDPSRTDDSATLESTDGKYRRTVKWTEGEKKENGVILKFKDVKPNKKYNLLIDPGVDGEPFYAFKNVKATKELLKKHMGG